MSVHSSSSGSSSSPSSSTDSLASRPLHNPSASPCSPSILLNPLPSPPSPAAFPSSTSKFRRPSVIAKVVSISAEPPAHFLAENPGYGRSPPRADSPMQQRRGRSADPHGGCSPDRAADTNSLDDDGSSGHSSASCVKFAELPPGRRNFRSNSLTLGVAARAHMITGGTPNAKAARYGGPQQWYQPGAVQPEDVYTIKDVQKGLSKLWTKCRRRSTSSTSSTGSDQARAMEIEGKGKSKEIEHIEECAEEDEQEHFDSDGDDDDDDERTRGRQPPLSVQLAERERARDSNGFDSGTDDTSSTENVPRTPEDSHLEEKGARTIAKGKGVDHREHVGFV